MTPSEERILQLIQTNPYITQQEIADILGIARSSVAVHISHMMTKGDILGRGYLLPDLEEQTSSRYAVVLGGANVDIVGRPSESLVAYDSNPGNIHISPGGVARNIASNISKMNVLTELIVPLGGDERGRIIEENKNRYLSLSHSVSFPSESTGTYLVLLDEEGEMACAVSDMRIMEKMTKEVVDKKRAIISSAEVLVIDTNIPQETIEHVLISFDVYKIVDAVSAAKASRLKNSLKYINLLKCNKYEAEILSDIKISSQENILQAGKVIAGRGVETIVITNGKLGAYLFHEDEVYHFWSNPLEIENATGAGDAFCALLAYGRIRKFEMIDSLINAMAASRITLKSDVTETNRMNQEALNVERKEVFYEKI